MVIQQSAKHLKGRNAMASKGGVDPHTSSGPIPVFVVFRYFDLQACKYGRQQRTDRNATSMTIRLLLQNICDDFSFVATRVVG